MVPKKILNDIFLKGAMFNFVLWWWSSHF